MQDLVGNGTRKVCNSYPLVSWSSSHQLHREGKIDERFRPTYDKLIDIRNKLEKLSLTQAWSLRETDLYSYQRQLDRIDESRVSGNFEDGEGHKADLHAQRVSTRFRP